jgi:hypothetical protein
MISKDQFPNGPITVPRNRANLSYKMLLGCFFYYNVYNRLDSKILLLKLKTIGFLRPL